MIRRWLQHFYRASSRELQRLESLSRAPVLSHLSDTLGGLVTVRAFGAQRRLVAELCAKVDGAAAAFLALQGGCRWLGAALDSTGAAMVFASVVINLVRRMFFFYGVGRGGGEGERAE